MKGCHWQRRRFSLQTLCVVQSPTPSEEETSQSGNHPASAKVKEVRPSRGREAHVQQREAINSSCKSTPTPPPPAKSHYKVSLFDFQLRSQMKWNASFSKTSDETDEHKRFFDKSVDLCLEYSRKNRWNCRWKRMHKCRNASSFCRICRKGCYSVTWNLVNNSNQHEPVPHRWIRLNCVGTSTEEEGKNWFKEWS